MRRPSLTLAIQLDCRRSFIWSKSGGKKERNANDNSANKHWKTREKRDCTGFLLCFWSPLTVHINETLAFLFMTLLYQIFFCKLTEAVSVWCDQWFNAKGACIAQGQKLKIQSAACIWFLSYKCSFKIFHWKQWQRNLVMSLMVISMTRNNTTCNSFNYTWHTQNSSNQLVRGIFQTLSLLYNWRD